jgi:hypothetical protein
MQWGLLLCRAGFAAACVLAVKLCGFGVGIAHADTAPVQSRSIVTAQMQALGIPFLANDGEVDSRVALYARTPTSTLFVGRDGVLTYLLTARDRRSWALKERFIGAKSLSPAGRGLSTTHVARFTPAGDGQNVISAPTYQWADIGEVWSGISVDVKATGANTEKFFHIAPHASASDIRVNIEGADHLAINSQGELAAATGLGEAVFSRPVAWQEVEGVRRPVGVRYALHGGHRYGFALGPYDHRHELIIDPLLQSTYIGGTGGEDHVTAIAINPGNGDVYVTGVTSSISGFPVSAGALQTTLHSLQDAFVAQLPANLKSFTQVTYFGGNQDDEGQGILIHPNGDVYVAGYTRSNDLPGTAGGAVATNVAGNQAAYLIRLDPTLTVLRQGTYYGNNMRGQADIIDLLKLAADATGAVYLAGSANSTILQGTAGGAIPTVVNGRPGFIAKFSADLKNLIQATYVTGGVDSLGLSAQNSIGEIVIDPATGDVLIAGTSNSRSLPVTSGAFQKTLDADMGAGGFVARLPNTLTSFTALSYVESHSTRPQSSHNTAVVSLALHPTNGDIYLYGGTDGDLLDGSAGGYVPTTSFNVPSEFLMRVAPDLTVIRNATFLSPGGQSFPSPFSVRIPASGDVYTAGYQCADTSGGIQPGGGGESDVCVARWAPDLHALVQETLLGGNGAEDEIDGGGSTGAALAVGIAGDVYLAGGTNSTNYPGTSGGAQSTFPVGSSASGYVARITADLAGAPQPGTLQFSAATYSVADNAGVAEIFVNRANGSSGAISVTVASSDGTGMAGVDYTASSQVLAWADGDNTAKAFDLAVKVDSATAGNKTVNLTLSGATGGATIGTQSTAVLTITATSTPLPGSLQLSAGTYSIADNAGTVSIGVTRSGGTAGAVTIVFATADGSGLAGTNYTTTTQTVAFADGDAAVKTVSIPVKLHGIVGSSFTVNLGLTAPTGGATLGSPATAVLTINATTPAPVPVSSTVTVNGKGGGGAMGLLELIVLSALLFVQVMRTRLKGLPPRFGTAARNHRSFRWLLALGILGAALPASADSPGFYAGFGVGQVRSDAGASDLARKLDAAGFPGATVSIDDRKLAGKGYAGASFNSYLALEIAYVDLNRVRTHSTAATADVAGFVAAVTAIHPYSARGGSFTALASLPVAGGLSVFARGGGFAWHGEIDAAIPGIDADSTKKTGLSGIIGAGVDFAFTRQLAVRAEWERYFISRDSMDLATLGLRYRF